MQAGISYRKIICKQLKLWTRVTRWAIDQFRAAYITLKNSCLEDAHIQIFLFLFHKRIRKCHSEFLIWVNKKRKISMCLPFTRVETSTTKSFFMSKEKLQKLWISFSQNRKTSQSKASHGNIVTSYLYTRPPCHTTHIVVHILEIMNICVYM